MAPVYPTAWRQVNFLLVEDFRYTKSRADSFYDSNQEIRMTLRSSWVMLALVIVVAAFDTVIAFTATDRVSTTLAK